MWFAMAIFVRADLDVYMTIWLSPSIFLMMIGYFRAVHQCSEQLFLILLLVLCGILDFRVYFP
jgi:hypothetical protein